MLCATPHSVVDIQTVQQFFPLSSACSCASTSAEAHHTEFPGCPSPQLQFSPKPCCPVSPGLQETAWTTRLVLTSSIPQGDCPRSGVFRSVIDFGQLRLWPALFFSTSANFDVNQFLVLNFGTTGYLEKVGPEEGGAQKGGAQKGGAQKGGA